MPLEEERRRRRRAGGGGEGGGAGSELLLLPGTCGWRKGRRSALAVPEAGHLPAGGAS